MDSGALQHPRIFFPKHTILAMPYAKCAEELIDGARNDAVFRSRLRVMDIDESDLQQLLGAWICTHFTGIGIESWPMGSPELENSKWDP